MAVISSGSRPARIDQVIPTIVVRDAVSGHTLEAQRVLRDLGYQSDIYALNIGVELLGAVRPLVELGSTGDRSRWLLYQASIGSPAADVFAESTCPKLINYHNITPVELIGWWEPHLAGELELGRRQLADLAEITSFAIAVSSYNESELIAAGYPRTAVAPFLVDLAESAPADPQLSARLAAESAGGGANWLFVGQIAPHKAQHDVIKAFAFYQRAYDPDARLRIIGRESSPCYVAALRCLVSELGLGGSVTFEGSVSEAAKTAYYEHADVFVGCSEHEGFCAPLIEAMHHDLPIVAYGAAAVPETVRDAGLVLPTKSPSLVAAAVRRVVTDGEMRTRLSARARQRAAEFTIEAARESFAEAMEAAVSGGGPS